MMMDHTFPVAPAESPAAPILKLDDLLKAPAAPIDLAD